MQVYRSELSADFVNLFSQTIGLDEGAMEVFLSHIRREFIPKKFFYLHAGDITRQKAYINKGSTRSFIIDEKGNEHILYFAFEGWWIGDLESYHTGRPGKMHVQATEDCELLCIAKDDFETLAHRFPKLREWNEMKQRRAHFATLDRLAEVKSLSAEERYLALMDKYPFIFQRIPLQYIAAYLDIEPQSLSRLRKRLSGK